MKIKEILFICYFGIAIVMSSCKKDFLERAPLSAITPDNYLVEESQLASYAIKMYEGLPVYGSFAGDIHTDTDASRSYDGRYVPGDWKVGNNGGDWEFSSIFQCNYFLETVVPRYEAGEIAGSIGNIEHYIGEMYFFRAWSYFKMLQSIGDAPIIRTTLSDNHAELIEASKRSPQNEVARFIISDLDSAIMLMNNVSPDGKKNRLAKSSAQLIKSRVALYEGTLLKYFKGTAFVPNGPNWPGKSKDYNASYTFPSGSIEGEIEYFLNEAMEASKAVAEAFPLVDNSMTQRLQAEYEEFALASENNPYAKMFSEEDLSGFSEVLLWRDYDIGLKLTNSIGNAVQEGSNRGLTRGLVDRFLMANGLPIYATESGYIGDDYISSVRENRDGRLWLFLAEPGQINVLHPSPLGTHATPIVIIPDILNLLGNHDAPTGYVSRKGNVYDGKQLGNGLSDVGSIVFRAAEAYLNYMEACYEKNGSLDGTAQSYWKQIRSRAGVDSDFQKTISATNLTKEAENDWAVYSAGQMIDEVLYNIRRERSCELTGEGLRYMDLRRWRAMDQLITKPYHIEGFKLWGPMKEWYDQNALTYDIGDKSTVSSPTASPYLRVYQRTPTSRVYDGYKWTMAHYFSPIAIQHFLITSENNDVLTSPIYQNVGWPIDANLGPIE